MGLCVKPFVFWKSQLGMVAIFTSLQNPKSGCREPSWMGSENQEFLLWLILNLTWRITGSFFSIFLSRIKKFAKWMFKVNDKCLKSFLHSMKNKEKMYRNWREMFLRKQRHGVTLKLGWYRLACQHRLSGAASEKVQISAEGISARYSTWCLGISQHLIMLTRS